VCSAAGYLALQRRRRPEKLRPSKPTIGPSTSAPSVAAFICYARTDSGVAGEIANHLNGRGIDTFLDTTSIRGGERWRDSIVAAIEQCKVVLVLVSPSSNASKEVADEVNLARAENRLIIPLLLEGQKPRGALSYLVGSVHGIHVFSEDLQPSLELIVHNLASHEVF